MGTQDSIGIVRRPHFSLRALFLCVTGFACLFAYLSYFRSTRAAVAYTFLTVNSSDFDALALNHNDVSGSPYRWAYLDFNDLQTLLPDGGAASEDILRRRASIHIWPMQAETGIGSRSVLLEVNDARQGEYPAKLPMYETATLNGFFGVRLAGGALQFRVDVEVGYDRPDDDVEPRDMDHPRDSITGKLFYQGQAPEHALLFSAPLDDHTHQVVVFTVTE